MHPYALSLVARSIVADRLREAEEARRLRAPRSEPIGEIAVPPLVLVPARTDEPVTAEAAVPLDPPSSAA